MFDFNNTLNPPQLEAVETVDGPLLILAGAGSGKTRVITYRIANLIAHYGVPRGQILSVTFTNKAAREMKERIETLMGDRAPYWMSTFHSICARILRYEAAVLGLNPNFTICDTTDKQNILKRIIRDDFNMDTEKFPPKNVAKQISQYKSQRLTPALAEKEYGDDFYQQRVLKFYAAYEEKMRQIQSVDFDDLIMKTVLLFENHADVLQRYQERFRYILVDEYQDTNHLQYLLLKMLAAKHHNICVVGDDDQSIYGWRGADISNILNFERDYPKTKIIRLEQNYRSTGAILKAANAIAQCNSNRREKRLWTEKSDGDPLEFHWLENEFREADFIVNIIQREKLNAGDVAIFYRTNGQSRALEEAFRKSRIPYQVFGGTKFYSREEIKNALAYLRLLVNPDDEESLLRVINVPKRSVGQRTVEKLQMLAREHHLSILEVLKQTDKYEELRRSQRGLLHFAETLQKLEEAMDTMDLEELVNFALSESGLFAYYNEKDEENRLENLDSFVNGVQHFAEEFAHQNDEAPTLEDFLQSIALQSEIDDLPEDAAFVSLMTIHNAKGLEYPVVFIAGCEKGLLPHLSSINEGNEEEERRVFYVAVTRAQEKLYLTAAKTRFVFGEKRSTIKSSFLDEIPAEVLQMDLHEDAVSAFSRQSSTFSKEPSAFSPSSPKKRSTASGRGIQMGDIVVHAVYGRGRVMAVEGEGSKAKLQIRFTAGTKKIVASYVQKQ